MLNNVKIALDRHHGSRSVLKRFGDVGVYDTRESVAVL